MFYDSSDFKYGTGAGDVTGSVGASNPTGAYVQSSAGGPGTGINYYPSAPTPQVGLASVIGSGSPTAAPGGLGTGLGWNIGTAQLALGGLETIGSLWNAWQANKLAKAQFNFQKNFANANLSNQIQNYNTTLEDRSRSRAFTEGQDPATAQAYIDHNRLADRRIN
jgi:hypothetical protein